MLRNAVSKVLFNSRMELLTNKKRVICNKFIDDYNKVKEMIGHSPSATEILEYGHVSSYVYTDRFGSWNEFKKSLGDQREHSKERIIKQYNEFYSKYNHHPTIREIRKHKLITDNTIRKLWKSYATFIEEMGGNVRKYTKLDLSKESVIRDYNNAKKKIKKIPFEMEMEEIVSYKWGSALLQYFGGGHLHFLKEIGDYEKWVIRNKGVNRSHNTGRRKYDKKKIKEILINIIKKTGTPTKIELRQRKNKNLPSYTTLRNIFGASSYDGLIEEINK